MTAEIRAGYLQAIAPPARSPGRTQCRAGRRGPIGRPASHAHTSAAW